MLKQLATRLLRLVLWHMPIEPCKIDNPDNLIFHPEDAKRIFNRGCIFQSIGKITIGKGTIIGPYVGIITSNHDYLGNIDDSMPPEDVVIGDKCWLGMHSIILPGVVLGDHTIVGASSIVTKSFPEGNCIIVGNPARKIKDLKA